jgi:phosphoribosylanthranilate isomerase
MVKVKICGITNDEDALASVAFGADALGFNFWPASKRYIEPDRAREIVERLPPFVTVVGVFVNEYDLEVIARTVVRAKLDVVQLHGDESPAFCRQVAERWRVIKAVGVVSDLNPAELAAYPVSAILLDRQSPNEYGGTGMRFDWSIARRAAHYVPRLILAGGLSPHNVAEAIRQVRPYAVDACSCLEEYPGKKDHEKLRAFLAQARLPD